jgi:hypothetical protein
MTPDSRYPTGPGQDHPGMSLRPMLEFVGILAAVLGLVAIVIGLVYGVKMFEAIFNALDSPAQLSGRIDALAQALGGDSLSISIDGQKTAVAKPLAAILLGCGATLLVWMSLGFIAVGVRSVTWLLTDREAVKRVLRQVAPQRNARYGRDSDSDRSAR